MNDGGEEYETLEEGSSDDSSEDEGNIPVCGEKESNEGHQIIRNHSLAPSEDVDEMIANNNFVRLISTAQEWDAVDDCDPSSPGPINEDDEIPTYIYEGMTFASKELLQFALMGWSIVNNVEYHKTCSNKTRLSVECINRKNATRPCPWRVHAICSNRRGGYWQITKTGAQHNCTHPIMARGHVNLTSRFISNYIVSVIRNQIDIKPREIIARMNSKFSIRTSYHKAWDARRKAIQKVFGSYEESYASLFRLMESIIREMPGSVYRIRVRSTNRFQSIFWAFGPSIEAWKFCRPVLSLDGTFLLGKYRGTLLAAVGQDANGGLLPLAFAIVDSESTDSWTWFLHMLLELVEPIRSRPDLCIISDKHHGLIQGCREVMPWVAHVHCLRHLRENFKKFLRRIAVVDVEGMCKKMYSAGSTDDERHFNRHMRDIGTMKKEAHDWLVEKDITKWTLVHDGGSRYGSVTTNSSESFNGVLKKARGLPIQGLIISIYYKLIHIFLRRANEGARMAAAGDSIFVPKTATMLRTSEENVRHFPAPRLINQNEFQVFDKMGRGFKVVVTENETCSCTCKKSQIYHVPCIHAIVALSSRRIDHTRFVSSYFKIETFMQIYDHSFHNIPDREFWPPYDEYKGIIPLIPPTCRRRAGRPRSTRIRNTMDERPTSSRMCSICRNVGHNSATCPNNTTIRLDRRNRPNRAPPH